MILAFACGGSSSTGTPNSPFGEGFIWCAFFSGSAFSMGFSRSGSTVRKFISIPCVYRIPSHVNLKLFTTVIMGLGLDIMALDIMCLNIMGLDIMALDIMFQ